MEGNSSCTTPENPPSSLSSSSSPSFDDESSDESSTGHAEYPWHLDMPMLFPYHAIGGSVIVGAENTTSAGSRSSGSRGSINCSLGSTPYGSFTLTQSKLQTSIECNDHAVVAWVHTQSNFVSRKSILSLTCDVDGDGDESDGQPVTEFITTEKRCDHADTKNTTHLQNHILGGKSIRCPTCSIAKTHRIILGGACYWPLTNCHSHRGVCLSCRPSDVPKSIIQRYRQTVYGKLLDANVIEKEKKEAGGGAGVTSAAKSFLNLRGRKSVASTALLSDARRSSMMLLEEERRVSREVPVVALHRERQIEEESIISESSICRGSSAPDYFKIVVGKANPRRWFVRSSQR